MPTPPNQAADVLVLQHTTEDTPAHLGVWLDRQGLRWHCPCAEAGEAYPASVRGYRALAVLGGEWLATDWLGAAPDAVVYQWHYDSFTTLPAGATLLASSPACAHQAFALGPHLAMQFHIEITPDKIEAWLQQPGAVYPRALHAGVATVQSPATMRVATAQCQGASEALADHIYSAWRRRWR